MRIKEFSLIRYGPLPETGRVRLGEFNLFFGRNEDGKTLTIDALVKLMLGRNIRDFERIDRVEENPEGYMVIEDDKGEEVKLPEQGDLTEILGLSPSECRNIFVVRNSDLSIARENEFYTNVTDRLAGLRTDEISKIKESLREIGKLTPTGIFRDIKNEKLKTRIENAKRLTGKIKTLAEEIEREGFDRLEEASVELRERVDQIVQEKGELEDARKREAYQKGKRALDKLKNIMRRLRDLEVYNKTGEQSWRDCERDLERWNEERKGLVEDLGQNEEELKKIREELGESKRNLEVLEKRKARLDDEVTPELSNHKARRQQLAFQEQKIRFFTLMGITSPILLGVFVLGVIARPLWPFYILAALFFGLTFVSWLSLFQFVRNRAHLARALERIKLTLSEFGLQVETMAGILYNIRKFRERHAKNDREIQELGRKKDILEHKVGELREKIPRIDQKIEDAKDKIDELARRSKEESLGDYANKLRLKEKYGKSEIEQRSSLEGLFGAKGKARKENISHWNERIKELEEYKNKAKDVKYDEKTIRKLIEEQELCEGKLGKIREKMSCFRGRLEEIEREVDKILWLESDYLHCKTSVDLEGVKDKLDEFISENGGRKDLVLEVTKIFEEIETEEKEKVSGLFGKGSAVSKHFGGITDGLYEEVAFKQELGRIEVRRKDGKVLGAEKLSGGAYDQLYLCVRLALGAKLLKGKKGFFIMDDPFVKADPHRLQRQIETIKKIPELGWQVLYFSAKEEVRDILKKDIEKGAINHIEIQGIFT